MPPAYQDLKKVEASLLKEIATLDATKKAKEAEANRQWFEKNSNALSKSFPWFKIDEKEVTSPSDEVMRQVEDVRSYYQNSVEAFKNYTQEAKNAKNATEPKNLLKFSEEIRKEVGCITGIFKVYQEFLKNPQGIDPKKQKNIINDITIARTDAIRFFEITNASAKIKDYLAKVKKTGDVSQDFPPGVKESEKIITDLLSNEMNKQLEINFKSNDLSKLSAELDQAQRIRRISFGSLQYVHNILEKTLEESSKKNKQKKI